MVRRRRVWMEQELVSVPKERPGGEVLSVLICYLAGKGG